MATRTRKAKTNADLDLEIQKLEKRLNDKKRQAYAGQLQEMVKKLDIAASFKKIKEGVKGVTDLAILEAIGRAAGVQRLVVTQAPAKPRNKAAKKASTKPA